METALIDQKQKTSNTKKYYSPFKNLILSYIKSTIPALLEDNLYDFNFKHIKDKKDVFYKNKRYYCYAYIQVVATGVFLKHWFWVDSSTNEVMMVNTEMKFKRAKGQWVRSQAQKINSSSMYDTIGEGTQLTHPDQKRFKKS